MSGTPSWSTNKFAGVCAGIMAILVCLLLTITFGSLDSFDMALWFITVAVTFLSVRISLYFWCEKDLSGKADMPYKYYWTYEKLAAKSAGVLAGLLILSSYLILGFFAGMELLLWFTGLGYLSIKLAVLWAFNPGKISGMFNKVTTTSQPATSAAKSKESSGPTCKNGHPVDSSVLFCETCGAKIEKDA